MSQYTNVNTEVREDANFNIAVPPQSMASATVYASPWISIHEVRRLLGLAAVECASDGTVLTGQIYEAQDAAGTGAQLLVEVEVTADGEQSLLSLPEVRETDVTDEYTYLRVQMQHDEGSALNGSALYAVVPYKRPVTPKTSDTKDCTTTTTAAP